MRKRCTLMGHDGSTQTARILPRVTAARYTRDVDEVFLRLRVFHGIPRAVASERLHDIKRRAGFPGDYQCTFDLTGNVFVSQDGECLGTLTQGGAP